MAETLGPARGLPSDTYYYKMMVCPRTRSSPVKSKGRTALLARLREPSRSARAPHQSNRGAVQGGEATGWPRGVWEEDEGSRSRSHLGINPGKSNSGFGLHAVATRPGGRRENVKIQNKRGPPASPGESCSAENHRCGVTTPWHAGSIVVVPNRHPKTGRKRDRHTSPAVRLGPQFI